MVRPHFGIVNSMEQINTGRRVSYGGILLFVFFWFSLYFFFRYVQPIAPWDGDDWNTVMSLINWKSGAFPELKNGYFTPHMFGALAGMLSGFLVYPITGDYITSYIVVGAIFLASAITLSLISLYRLYFRLSKNSFCSFIGIVFFFFLGFLIFKTSPLNENLYYRTNYCTIFFYELPSYLSAAFSITLIVHYLDNKDYFMNFHSGLVLLCAYCLTFSFVPAAFLLVSISFALSIMKFRDCKDLHLWIQKSWVYIVIEIFFLNFFCFELTRTFGTGYFKKPENFFEQILESLDLFLENFTIMHPLFCLLSIVILICVFLFFRFGRKNEMDYSFMKISFVLLISIFLTAIYFVLFGVADISHIRYENIVRLDTMYVFFFQLIAIVGLF